MKNKVVLITGGNSGIGFATARRFLDSGYTVLISGRNAEALEKAKVKLGDKKVHTYVADVSNLNALDTMYEKIAKDGFTLDSVVINAAIANTMPFESVTEEHFDTLMNTNVKGALFTLQKALPLMAKKSTAVFVTSIARTKATPGFTVYGGTKGAIKAIMNTAAMELISTRGVRVNAVSPGPINTPMYPKLGIDGEDLQNLKEGIGEQLPIKRFGEAVEIANVIFFLSSDESSFMVGHEVVASGGINLL